ncbi:methyltransferase [Chelativorans sp. ZYF759]|uniref:tRNA1(Val) (adenine(37)-N6)-methyltransferase n=1 Tax=Chelativorans sp. ZYF759 TaxID=2692213 RepID=UPI00145CF4E7|nr:methyltransferase [Chelativorans sp. ZYF759]NMG38821.1 methyltransferase [Chelativorans sp. ZYF759]
MVTGSEAGDAAYTTDAFHRGRFFLVQPARKGHRAGTDALLLAAAVPDGFSGRVADLGAGAGAAGLAVAARCGQAEIVLVENAPEMLHCARATLALPQNAPLAARCAVLEADVRLAGDARRAAGLADAAFDFVILNPPFNPASDRPSPDALRRRAHMMEDAALLGDWLATAASTVKPGGGVAIIARPQSLDEVVSALSPTFGAIEIRPILPRADKPAIRFVARGRRGASAGLSTLPPLVLHREEDNRFTEEAEAIGSGRAALFGD